MELTLLDAYFYLYFLFLFVELWGLYKCLFDKKALMEEIQKANKYIGMVNEKIDKVKHNNADVSDTTELIDGVKEYMKEDGATAKFKSFYNWASSLWPILGLFIWEQKYWFILSLGFPLFIAGVAFFFKKRYTLDEFIFNKIVNGIIYFMILKNYFHLIH